MKMNKKNERIGLEKYNNYGELMKIILYDDANNITVEFQDEWKSTKQTCWDSFNKGSVRNPHNNRLYLENYNNQGCLMKIIEYINANNITIEFQDKFKSHIHTRWKNFRDGDVKNPYYSSVLGIGITGNKYDVCYIDENGKKKNTKEYQTWLSMLHRCFDEKEKLKYPTYKDVTCCNEWLLYENFYEWLHSQENFDKWKTLDKSALDKDIIYKGNKIYSPDTCCLVPSNVNSLFVKNNANRGLLPIGVTLHNNKYRAQLQCENKYIMLKSRETYEEAFKDYKYAKEKWIKQVAQEEYNKGTITKKCYYAMMNYQVEITD